MAYLADILAELNNLNLKLQDYEINLAQSNLSIHAFVEKLPFYRQNIERRDSIKFPCCKKANTYTSDETLHISIEHLKTIDNDIKLRFRDLSAPDISLWILDPFQTINISIVQSIEIELIDVRNGFEVMSSFKRHTYPEFWLVNYYRKLPVL